MRNQSTEPCFARYVLPGAIASLGGLRQRPTCSVIALACVCVVSRAQRQSLPAWNFAEALADAVADNQVTIVSGHTGCGKSTQVPQFILDDPRMGPTATVVVTQPRRISAISLAERYVVAGVFCVCMGLICVCRVPWYCGRTAWLRNAVRMLAAQSATRFAWRAAAQCRRRCCSVPPVSYCGASPTTHC